MTTKDKADPVMTFIAWAAVIAVLGTILLIYPGVPLWNGMPLTN